MEIALAEDILEHHFLFNKIIIKVRTQFFKNNI